MSQIWQQHNEEAHRGAGSRQWIRKNSAASPQKEGARVTAAEAAREADKESSREERLLKKKAEAYA